MLAARLLVVVMVVTVLIPVSIVLGVASKGSTRDESQRGERPKAAGYSETPQAMHSGQGRPFEQSGHSVTVDAYAYVSGFYGLPPRSVAGKLNADEAVFMADS